MSRVTYLFEATPYDPSLPGLRNVNFSSGLLEETIPGSSASFPVRLAETFSYEVTIFSDGNPGSTSTSIGTCVVNNVDGRFDHLLLHNWDDRPLVIKQGIRGQSYGDYSTLFVGRTLEATADGTNLVFSLKDNGAKLIKMAQTLTYLGTGGKEGGADLRGLEKPLLYGDVRNANPVLVDPIRLTYQFSTDPLTSITGIYNRAIPLTFSADYPTYAHLLAAPLLPGSYSSCRAEGFIRLGAPPDGLLTGSVRGPKYSDFLGNMARLILKNKGGFVDADFDLTSFNQLDTDFPYDFEGMYYRQPTFQWNEFLDTIATSINGYWYLSRTGLIRLEQFKFRTPSAVIRSEDMVNLSRVSSPAPVKKVKVDYARNPHVVDTSEYTIPRSTFNGFISKSHQFIQTDSNGSGGTYVTDAVFKVFLDDEQINDLGLVTFEVLPGSASGITIDSTGAIFFPTSGSVSRTATLRANFGEYAVDANFTVTKSMGSLKRIELSSNRNHILISDSGALEGNQDVTVTVTTTGTTLTSLTVEDNLGNFYTPTNNGNGTYTFSTSQILPIQLAYWLVWKAYDSVGLKQSIQTRIRRGTVAPVILPIRPGSNEIRLTIYQRSITEPALPSVNAVFSFITGHTTGLNNGWLERIPPINGLPVWTSDVLLNTSGTTMTITPGLWSPVKTAAPTVAQQIIDLFNITEINTDSILSQVIHMDELEVVLDARTLVEGQPVSVKFLEFRGSQITENTATAYTLGLLGAETEDGTAFILNMNNVKVSPDKTLAQRFSEVGVIAENASAGYTELANLIATESGVRAEVISQLTASFNTNNTLVTASINEIREIVIGPDGPEARAVLQVDAFGNLAGIVTSANELIGRIGIIAGLTEICAPDGSVLASFSQVGSLAYISNLLVDKVAFNSVGTEQLLDDSVTAASQASNGASWSGSGIGTYVAVVSYTVNLAYPGDLILIGSLQLTHAGQGYAFRLMVDGNEVQSGTGNEDHYLPMQGRIWIGTAGSKTVSIEVAGAVGVSLNPGAASLVTIRRYR